MYLKSFNRHFIAAAAGAAAFLLACPSADARAHYAPVAVTINGSLVNFSPPPVIETGRVFVPLRHIFERLGASVVYANRTINATRHERTISLRVGSVAATVDGRPVILDASPFIAGASTYVPLRFISQALGAVVSWDNVRRVAAIDIRERVDAAPVAEAAPAGEPDSAPPPIEANEQPEPPGPDYIWQPGYWGWASAGYYWVPGAWALPPEAGYLWTPGYWLASGERYVWHSGYWGRSVGYYGGVNYGGGYNGNGYTGRGSRGGSVPGRTSGGGPEPGHGAGSDTPVAPGRGDHGAQPGPGHENPTPPERSGEPPAGPRGEGGAVAAASSWSRFGDGRSSGSAERPAATERGDADAWSRFGSLDARQLTGEHGASDNAWSHISWPSQGWSHSAYGGRTQSSGSYGWGSRFAPSSRGFQARSASGHTSPGYARSSSGGWHGPSAPASHQSAPSHSGGGGSRSSTHRAH